MTDSNTHTRTPHTNALTIAKSQGLHQKAGLKRRAAAAEAAGETGVCYRPGTRGAGREGRVTGEKKQQLQQ
jgi:hypothetical protein